MHGVNEKLDAWFSTRSAVSDASATVDADFIADGIATCVDHV